MSPGLFSLGCAPLHADLENNLFPVTSLWNMTGSLLSVGQSEFQMPSTALFCVKSTVSFPWWEEKFPWTGCFNVLGLLSKGLKTRDLQKKQNNFIQSQVRVQIRERSPAKSVSGPQERVFKGSRQQLTLHMAYRKEELVNKGCVLGGSLWTDRLGHILVFLTVHVRLFLDCITHTASYA